MIVAEAVLAGISASQHRHHDAAVAAEAARKAKVDRATLAEAGSSQMSREAAVRPSQLQRSTEP
jgi:hypothetical protein